MASVLTSLFFVTFFRELIIFPHIVDLSSSRVMVDSGIVAIARKISQQLAPLGSTSLALTSAIVYSLSSASARIIFSSGILFFFTKNFLSFKTGGISFQVKPISQNT